MRRAIGSRSCTASERRGRRRWSAAVRAPRRSTSGWRRCLCADLLVTAARLAVRDADGGDAGARKRERCNEDHAGTETVPRGIAELRATLVLAERHGVFRVHSAVEDERDDEADKRDGHEAAEPGDGRV